MKTKNPTHIVRFTTPQGDEMVILPNADYVALVTAAEDRKDKILILEFKRKLANGKEELISAEMAKRLVDGENPIRVWREHRGLSQADLSRLADVSPGYLSQIEANKRTPSEFMLKRLSDRLDVTPADLL